MFVLDDSVNMQQERFYFGDAVLPLFESGIPLLLEALKKLPDQDDVRFVWEVDWFLCLWHS